MSMQEISAPKDATDVQGSEEEGTREAKKWLMRASKQGHAPGGISSWFTESWTSFTDLLKVCLL